MQYLGGKTRIAKHIIPFLTKSLNAQQWYIEPFAGGFNMIDKIPHAKRWGNDKSKYLIALFRAIRQGWVPPTNITKEHYLYVKENKHLFEPHYVGYIGHAGGFGGVFFRGFAQNKQGQNYFQTTHNVLLKQATCLQNVRMTAYSYKELNIPNGSVVYCDPPYENVRQDYYVGGFDSNEFWDWVREIQKKNRVFISSYEAPDDFQCIWSKEIQKLAGTINREYITEKLWTKRCSEIG